MANKKVTPCEDFEFLPQRVQESTKLDMSEKNVLATLCFFRLNYSIFASEHDGWFYTSQKELEDGSGYSHKQLNRLLLKLSLKGVIQRRSGTNHKCTHYKLHPKIDELLPQPNDTLVEIEEKTDNDTLDKNRLDESSKDESRIDEKTGENNVSFAPLDEGAKTHKTHTQELQKMFQELEEVTNFGQLSEVGSRLRNYIRTECNDSRLEDYLNEKTKEMSEKIASSPAA